VQCPQGSRPICWCCNTGKASCWLHWLRSSELLRVHGWVYALGYKLFDRAAGHLGNIYPKLHVHLAS
jgi:hypothetical protein